METNNKIFEEKPKSSLTKVLEILSTMAIKAIWFYWLSNFNISCSVSCH